MLSDSDDDAAVPPPAAVPAPAPAPVPTPVPMPVPAPLAGVSPPPSEHHDGMDDQLDDGYNDDHDWGYNDTAEPPARIEPAAPQAQLPSLEPVPATSSTSHRLQQSSAPPPSEADPVVLRDSVFVCMQCVGIIEMNIANMVRHCETAHLMQ